MFIGNTRITSPPIPLWFVIGIHKSRIHDVNLHRLFEPYYAPELFEIIQTQGKGKFGYHRQAAEDAETVLAKLQSSWPQAHLHLVVTTGTLDMPAHDKNPIAEIVVKRHPDGHYKSAILNPQSIGKMAQGVKIVYPNSLRETTRNLLKFVQSLLRSRQPVTGYIPPPAAR